MGKIIDTHCHPYLNKEKDSEEVIRNFFQEGGESLVVIGTNIKTTKKVLELAQKPHVFCSIGVHPCDVYDLDLDETINFLETTYNSFPEKIVGIGECGLDYHRIYKDIHREKISLKDKEKLVLEKKEKQANFFRAQLELAKKLDLPAIIHNRDSKYDLFDIIKKSSIKKFVMHCYSEDLEFAEELLNYSPDAMISFSGIITFPNTEELTETVKNIPISNILAETDSPYLAPSLFRGKENEPSYVREVIKAIAEIRSEDIGYVENELLKNSKRFFGI